MFGETPIFHVMIWFIIQAKHPGIKVEGFRVPGTCLLLGSLREAALKWNLNGPFSFSEAPEQCPGEMTCMSGGMRWRVFRVGVVDVGNGEKIICPQKNGWEMELMEIFGGRVY